jgi:hypothetical protein
MRLESSKSHSVGVPESEAMPGRRQNDTRMGPLRFTRLLLKNLIAFPTQAATPRLIPYTFRFEQALKNVVLVDDREFEQWGKTPCKGGFAAARQARYHDIWFV